jgi:hypothetical protein
MLRFALYVAAWIIAITVLLWGISFCHVQAHEIYSQWTRKDSPSASCCSGNERTGDCYATAAKFDPQSGTWIALRREDHRWLRIPKEVYDPNEDLDGVRHAPQDGRAHLCAYPPGRSPEWLPNKNGIICFAPGSGV